MRVNARLDADYEEKLKYIIRQTRENFTEVLKKAIDLYHHHIKSAAKHGTQLILKSGFVGCAKGHKDLSVNYKKGLFKSLREK